MRLLVRSRTNKYEQMRTTGAKGVKNRTDRRTHAAFAGVAGSVGGPTLPGRRSVTAAAHKHPSANDRGRAVFGQREPARSVIRVAGPTPGAGPASRFGKVWGSSTRSSRGNNAGTVHKGQGENPTKLCETVLEMKRNGQYVADQGLSGPVPAGSRFATSRVPPGVRCRRIRCRRIGERRCWGISRERAGAGVGSRRWESAGGRARLAPPSVCYSRLLLPHAAPLTQADPCPIGSCARITGAAGHAQLSTHDRARMTGHAQPDAIRTTGYEACSYARSLTCFSNLLL